MSCLLRRVHAGIWGAICIANPLTKETQGNSMADHRRARTGIGHRNHQSYSSISSLRRSRHLDSHVVRFSPWSLRSFSLPLFLFIALPDSSTRFPNVNVAVKDTIQIDEKRTIPPPTLLTTAPGVKRPLSTRASLQSMSMSAATPTHQAIQADP
jgi:hypothetical protein